MPHPPRETHQQALSSLQASGFPFQTAIDAVVSGTPGWQRLARELPWADPSGTDQFLDLVVRNQVQIFGLECKKTQKDTLTFLVPNLSATETEGFVCLRAAQIPDSTRRMELENELWSVAPPSHEAAFCVVGTSEAGRNTRLLERDCQLLVRGLDAFAQTRQEQFHPDEGPVPATALYVPVLVTNAPIFLQLYDPSSVSLSAGQFDPMPRQLSPVPWIRFRKTFTSENGPHMGERSVFVVAATALTPFLAAFRPTSSEPTAYFGRLSRRPRRP